MAPLNKKSVIRVLHVDDELCLLEVSKQILTMENNFEIDNVTSVAEALKKIEDQQYDAIVSDYEMPLKNGLEFLKQLRDQNNQIPFILFTGRGREDVAVKALNLGADSYINKNGSTETVYCELADAINKTFERKKSRELLAKSESKYHALVENSLQGIAILQAAPLKLVFSNNAFGKTLGYSSEELTSLSPEKIMSLVYHEDRAVFFKRMENRLRGEPAGACFEFRAVRKDGSIIWLSSLANRVDYDGQPAVQGMFLDINESKIAAEILRESEQRYRELANCLPDIVFETDINGQLEFANERAAEISGYSLREIEKGVNIFQFIVPEDRARAIKNIQRLLQGGSYVPSEYKFIRKDGSTFPALVTATPRVCKNTVTGFRGIVLDISERKKAEEFFRKSEARYRELANFLPEIVFETDLSGKITFFSQNAFEISGFTPEELAKGMNMLTFVVPEDQERATENIKKALSGEKREGHEYTLYRKNGSTYPAIVKSAPIISENKVTGLRGLVVDITERKKMEEKLKINEKKYDTLINVTSTGYVILDGEGLVLDANLEYVRLTGHKTLDQIKGRSVTEWTAKHDLKRNAEEVKKCYQEGFVRNLEIDYVAEKGKITPIEINANVIESEQGSVIVTLCRDITERKKAEEELIESGKRSKAIVEYAPIGIATSGADKCFLSVNESFCKILGYSEEELRKLTFKDITHPKDIKESLLKMCDLENGRISSFSLEKQYIRKDETVIDGKIIVNAVLDQNGKPNLYVAELEDITERKKAEEALRRSEWKHRIISGITADVTFSCTKKGEEEFFVDWISGACEKIFGYSAKEIQEKGCWKFAVSPPDLPIFEEKITNLKLGQKSLLELRITNKNGSTRWLKVKSIVEEDSENPGGLRLFGACTDITERKQKDFELQLERDKLETVTENIGAGLFLVDKDYKILWTNKMSKHHFGELESKQCYLAFRNLNDVCPNCGVREIFENGKEIDVREYCFKDTKGDPGWLELTVRPVKDGTGKVVAALELAVPITERKKAEEIRKGLENRVKQYSEHLKQMVDMRTAQLKDANERLVKAERLAAIGELAGMIGHDLRNPLAGIKNGIYILKKKGTTISEAQAKETLEIIDKAIAHSNKIINDLLDYAREMNLKLIKYSARTLVDEAARTIQVPDRIQIINLVDEAACIWVDADKMIRVFVNLLQNAIDATPENGRIEITSYQRNSFVEIAFSDTGKGIPAEVLPKLFTPLFTTKAQGMGFGLAICKRIVEVHEGTIMVESVKGNGTKFIINLPVKSYPEPEPSTKLPKKSLSINLSLGTHTM